LRRLAEEGGTTMDVVAVYESRTGTTRAAALTMGDALWARGVGCRTFSAATGVDPDAVAAADAVVVGSWTDGLFVVGQRPGGRRRLDRVFADLAGAGDSPGPLAGKPCLVFCTYAVASGNTLTKLQSLVEAAGGRVVGGIAIRRDRIDDGASRLVDALTDLSRV
jgi:flavodoxin